MPMRLYVNTVSCSQWEWANCSIKVELFCFPVLQEVFYSLYLDYNSQVVLVIKFTDMTCNNPQ